MMFNDVEDNAGRQDRLFEDTKSTLIEDYYPELHDDKSIPFACTIGSNLIPDLMTRRRVLIDLDNLPTEADLINRFGVDKAFLVELRRRKLVHIATNLDPGEHEGNTWMHDILADRATIFKSTRTPRFFRASFPDIERAQRDLQQYLARGFEKLSTQAYDSLISRMDVIPRNASRSGAANKLAWDIARVQAMRGNDRDNNPISSPDEVFAQPTKAMDLLYRYKILAVSPHTWALGGMMLAPYQLMKRLFPETPRTELLRHDNTVHEEIMSYLAEVNLNVEPAELAGPAYWQDLSQLERARLLDNLEEDVETRASESVEQELRLRIARLDREVGRNEIRYLVEKDKARVERYEGICSRGYTVVNMWFAQFVGQYAGWVGCLPTWLAGEIVRAHAQKLLEVAVPRIRVANYVRYRSR